MDRDGRIRWWAWLLFALVLAAELGLSISRPVWLLSALATVVIAIVYVRVVRREDLGHEGSDRGNLIIGSAGVTSPAPEMSGSVLNDASLSVSASAPRRRRVVIGVAIIALVVIGVAVLIVGLSSQEPTSATAPITLLSATLRAAQHAVPALPPSDGSASVSFDGHQNHWEAGSLTLSVKARGSAGANGRITRAFVRSGWTAAPPRIGSDGSRYLRFSRMLRSSFSANTPSLTSWTATTTIALGVPDGFPLGSDSHVLVRAPSGMVGSTQPASISTFPVPGSDIEVTVIPFDSDTAAVSIELKGWVERHGAAKSIAGFVAPILIPSGLGAALWARVRRMLRRKRRRDEEDDDQGKGNRTPTRRNGRAGTTAGASHRSGQTRGRRRSRS